jgi:uncharacterized protein YgfB (UPF0149 family)
MFDPSKMTVSEAISALRDAGFLFGMVIAGWKGRSWIQPVIDFFHNGTEFMRESRLHQQIMESQMNLVLTNHLAHIEENLKAISARDKD